MTIQDLIDFLSQEDSDKSATVECFVSTAGKNSMQIWLSNLENIPAEAPTIDFRKDDSPGS